MSYYCRHAFTPSLSNAFAALNRALEALDAGIDETTKEEYLAKLEEKRLAKSNLMNGMNQVNAIWNASHPSQPLDQDLLRHLVEFNVDKIAKRDAADFNAYSAATITLAMLGLKLTAEPGNFDRIVEDLQSIRLADD
jgi:hypothetical protein